MKQTIINILTEKLKSYQSDYAEFEQIKDCLTPLDGTRITAHLQKKLSPGMKLTTEDGKVIIKFEKTGRNHIIAYASNKVIDVEQLEYLDCRNFSAAEQMQKIKNILEDKQTLEKMVCLCTSMQQGYDQLKTSLQEMEKNDFTGYYNPGYSDIIEAMNIPWQVISNIG